MPAQTTPIDGTTATTRLAAPTQPPAKKSGEKRGEKGRRTAERILDAAEEAFAESGFDGATLRDVANRVGVRIPSLYNHFESKESLYAAVLERGIGPLLQSLAESALNRGSRGQPEDIVRQTIEMLALRPNLPRLVLHETLAGGRHLQRILQSWLGPLLSQANKLVAEGPAAARWDRDQLPYLVLAMYNIVVGYFAMAPLYRDLSDIDLLSPEALAQQTEVLAKVSSLLFGPGEPL